MVIKTFSDGTQTVNTDRHEPFKMDEDIEWVLNHVSKHDSSQDFELLKRYTKWLERRGFFRDDLQCDFDHQIETFLNDFNK